MQKLRDYYKKLDALIGDIRIFHEEEEQNLKKQGEDAPGSHTAISVYPGILPGNP